MTATPRRALLALPLLLALAACGGDEAPDPAEAEAAPLVLASTDVAAVERGEIQSGIQITGTLEPAQQVDVKAQVGGTLGSLRYQEGDRVSRGAVMATVIAEGVRSQAAATRAGVGSAEAGVTSAEAGVSSAQAGVEAAQAQLALAREQAASAQLLYNEGAMSRLDYQAAQAQVEAAQAQVASARANLTAARGQVAAARGQVANAQSQATAAGEQAARTTVRSPLSGSVSARPAEPGEAVAPGQTLYTVVSTGALELRGQVGVGEAGRVRVGDPVVFQIDGYPGQTFRGSVSRVVATADPASRQVSVFLRLPNPSGLVGGLFATGTVVSETLDDALLVPESAVRTRQTEDGEAASVLVVRNDVIRQQPVGIVQRDPSRGVIAVQGEIQAGDRVVVAPTTDTVDGARVRLAGASSSAAPPRPAAASAVAPQ
ncbi:efflux RND transporter periplasmic adaptor subunit [Rubrivirga litoralis]|uniref:Efflux RND transporter periplasmic adaptor subunit n=1 Tax=Rubrivirga litoralis TaxID=3075598 RepID=A0ABU3BND1_9BACT|nr:efflux RND transporter periplasmic adaptor subunit [Rubrivirga sp. F394]MDT0630809.1 efflux RND transporter periplasmic adaptor subunit [Rubrivirga sp. F394]